MSPLAETMVAALKAAPLQFHDLVNVHAEASWPAFLKAWGELRAAEILIRNDDGTYSVAP